MSLFWGENKMQREFKYGSYPNELDHLTWGSQQKRVIN